MPKELLHLADWLPGLDEVPGERVPERVKVNVILYAGPADGTPELLRECVVPSVGPELWTRHGDRLQDRHEVGMYRYAPFPPGFRMPVLPVYQVDQASAEVNVGPTQVRDLPRGVLPCRGLSRQMAWSWPEALSGYPESLRTSETVAPCGLSGAS